jgi:outer membrane receptor protein involved in Fe transport
MKKLLLLITIIALAGCTAQTTTETEVEETEVSEQAQEETQEVTEAQTAVSFDNLDSYVSAVFANELEPAEAPDGFDRIRFGGVGDGLNVAPDGVAGNLYVNVEEGLFDGPLFMDDIRPFYLEKVAVSSVELDIQCAAEYTAECDELLVTTWYGPFEGPIIRWSE